MGGLLGGLIGLGVAAVLLAGCVTAPGGMGWSEEPAGREEPAAGEPGGTESPAPSEAELAFQEGEEWANSGAYAEAAEAYSRALALDPQYFEAYLGRAQAYIDLSRYEPALADLDQAVQLRPEDPMALGERAECLWRMEEYARSVEDLDRALALEPQDEWQQAWLHALRGDSLRLLGRHEEAVEEFTRAIEKIADYGFALARRGEAYRMLGEYERALEDLTRAIELEPGESFAYASRGEVHHQLGQLEMALTDLDKALELQPDYPWAADRRKELMATIDSQAKEQPAALEEPTGQGVAPDGEGARGEDVGRRVDPASLPLVAVMDFQVENMPASEGRLIVDLLSSALAGRQVYRVLERSQRDAILTEIEFSISGCADERCQLKAGRMLSADRIVVGSLGRVGGRYILNTKLLQVETGEVVATAYRVFKSLEELVDGCEQVAFSLSEP